MAGNTIALTKLLPPNSLSQQSPGAIATITIVTRRRQPSPYHLPSPSLPRVLFDCCVMVVVVDGDGWRERTPLSKARRGGIRCAVVWSPAVVVAHSQDPTSASAANAAALLFFPPALSLVHPALYLPALVLVRPQLLLEEPRWRSSAPPARPLTFDAAVSLLSPPPPPLWLIVMFFFLSSMSSSSTRPQSQRSKSQGYMRLLLTTHVPRCPRTDACDRVLALVFTWRKESPPETYHGGGCFVGGGGKIP